MRKLFNTKFVFTKILPMAPKYFFATQSFSMFLEAKLLYKPNCPSSTHSVTGVTNFLYWPITQQFSFAQNVTKYLTLVLVFGTYFTITILILKVAFSY